MYITKYGQYDGDSWEALMQICFRLKYESEHYQPIPASSGDSGIEGFTKTGKVFQCYCPDSNISSKDLYQKQRDKITTDVNKLDLYKKKLAGFLNGVKIKEWIFVTPESRMNDLILHCNTKTSEIKKLNLPILDQDFKIVIHDIDNFAREIPIALNADGQKLYIEKDKIDSSNVIAWRDQEIDLVANAIRKHSKRFSDSSKVTDEKVNALTNKTVESFLDHMSVLSKWQKLHPDDYEKYLVLLSEIEKEVQEMCMFPADDNNHLYKSLWTLVKAKISENFSYLTPMTIDNLTHGAIADWLLRCPLDFE